MPKFKFRGSFVELRKIIEDNGFNGKWESEMLWTGYEKYIFRSNDGGVLTLFASKTVICQGEDKDSQKLWDIVSKFLVEDVGEK